MKIPRGMAMVLPSLFGACVLASAPAAGAQESAATVRVRILHGDEGVPGVVVRLGSGAAGTDRDGRAVLRAPAGTHMLVGRRLGFAPDSLALTLRAGQDTSVTLALEEIEDELAGVVVGATRSERRVADEAVRVEVLAKEEIDEKVMMTPGDITMLLNETSGLRMQVTSPALGGAGVRIQGLGPRYTMMLSDGLPLYGGQSGGLSLLQIPPVDLGRVEVIKGSASAMYGAQALGGVINLVSRRAEDEAVREVLLNQTSRGGTDAVFFGARPFSGRWSGSLLAGAHRQDRTDVDGDGWADLAAYERFVARPRLFREGTHGSSLFLTSGLTIEDRRGGTMAGRTAPNGQPYAEGLDTRRGDLGGVARLPLGSGNRILSARASLAVQEHRHQFGGREERDRHRTGFAEVTHTFVGARATYLGGLALQRDDYRNTDVPPADFSQSLASGFAQAEVAASQWLTLSAAARVDAHDEHGTSLSPRLSALLRAPADGALTGWTLRLSAASGVFAPTILTEETEVVGMGEVNQVDDLRFERASTASVDVGGAVGVLEVNATVFASRVTRPLRVAGVPPTGPETYEQLRLLQATRPSSTRGTELVARYLEEPWHVTASYTYIDATEWDDVAAQRVVAPLTPMHAVGIVAMREWEETARIGFEFYYTGAQALEENPYRDESPSYVIIGALFERAFGRARVFVNFENITDARQTRTDPLLLPARGRGGRWTTDVWNELAGRTVNAGVRWSF